MLTTAAAATTTTERDEWRGKNVKEKKTGYNSEVEEGLGQKWYS